MRVVVLCCAIAALRPASLDDVPAARGGAADLVRIRWIIRGLGTGVRLECLPGAAALGRRIPDHRHQHPPYMQ